MDVFLLVLRLLITVVIAFLFGKLIAKLKLPSILGWLLTGMILGPHAFSLVNQQILDAHWYQTVVHIFECAVGLMIGTELVWRKLRQSGKSIIVTTLTQSLGTFVVVSAVFGTVFFFSGIPVYLAFVFGGIALATAPAPALSIVREFKTSGPVTQTLIPMAALDDIVGCIVFFYYHSCCCRKSFCRPTSYLFIDIGYFIAFNNRGCRWFAGWACSEKRAVYADNAGMFDCFYFDCFRNWFSV